MKIFKLILVSLFHLLWYQNTALVAAKEHHHDVTTTRNHDLTSNKDIQEVEEQHEMKEKDDQLLVLSSRKGRRSLGKRKLSSSFVNETRSDSFQSSHRSLGDAPLADRKRWQKIWDDMVNNISDDDIVATFMFATKDGMEGTDVFRVKLKDDICYIFADETNEKADWDNNFDYGITDIVDSGYTKTIRYRKWKWVWKRWYGYFTYTWKTNTETILDQGYTGFVKSFNEVSHSVEMNVLLKCNGATQYQYTGYSRGGALAQIIALHHFRNGLFNNVAKVSLVVFASPNALAGWSANALKDNLAEAVNVFRYTKVWTPRAGKYTHTNDIIRGLPPFFDSAADEKEVKCNKGYTNGFDVHKNCRGYDMI
eukprot:CAMPEP_0184855402 /NCGR_PEP_ID=MMETSP0580-20130426/672_1 /TAXON_ID=1118495 /ORGANISM="Dactyliosolen fragilissimus" /LENGTH=365 /DNA_ID=CAMNT_0027349913 /DNA_START=163 /DNA_END=1260 /DNA_ORIENTATION=-